MIKLNKWCGMKCVVWHAGNSPLRLHSSACVLGAEWFYRNGGREGLGMSHIPLHFSLASSRFSLSLEVPEESCRFCPVITGELAQGGNPVPEEKGECRESPISALGCSLHHGILTFPAGLYLE